MCVFFVCSFLECFSRGKSFYDQDFAIERLTASGQIFNIQIFATTVTQEQVALTSIRSSSHPNEVSNYMRMIPLVDIRLISLV